MKPDKNALTESDKEYIKKNRLELSMYAMADVIGKPYNRVRDYMRANNLQLTKEQVNTLRVNNTYNNHKNKPRKKITKPDKNKAKAWDWDALP